MWGRLLYFRLALVRANTVVLAALLLTLCMAAQPSSLHAAWFPEGRLTYDPANSSLSTNNARCIGGDSLGVVHVVWYDRRDGNDNIYHKRYDGTVWADDERLTSADGASTYPSLAVAPGGEAHLVWTDGRDGTAQIYYKFYDGSTWAADERLTVTLSYAQFPSVAVDGDGHPHVVWHDTRDADNEIYYKLHNGSTWGADTRLTEAAGNSLDPCVCVGDSGEVYVVWCDMRDGNFEIYCKVWAGSAWGDDQRLTNDGGSSLHPAAALDGSGVLHVVWEDNRDGNFEVYWKYFDGGSWSSDLRITIGAGNSRNPSLARTEEGLCLAWSDDRDGSSEIYYATHSGTTWSPNERLTLSGASSINPSAGSSGEGDKFIVWQDNRTGAYEIYWRRAYSEMFDAPTVVSVSPDSGAYGEIVKVTAICGSKFMAPDSVWLAMDGMPRVIAQNVIVKSTSLIECDIDLSLVHFGWWDVLVQNPDGQTTTLEDGFFVIPRPAPSITYISPDAGPQGGGVWIDDLHGSGFVAPVTAWLERPGDSLFCAHGVVVENSTQISSIFSLEEADSGYWDVLVQNPDGLAATLVSGFYVQPTMWKPSTRLVFEGHSRTSEPNARCVAEDSNGSVHVVWDDLRDGKLQIYHKLRVGDAWGDDERLTVTTHTSAGPCIAADRSGNVHVVWYDGRDGDWEIYYKGSIGPAWLADERLTASSGHSRDPAIAAGCNSTLHVVWRDNRDGPFNVYYKSFDSSVWSEDLALTDYPPGADVRPPCVAVDDSGAVHVVWTCLVGEGGIYHSKLAAGEWSPPGAIAVGAQGHSPPSLSPGPGNAVHAVWKSTGVWHRYYQDGAWRPAYHVLDVDGAESPGVTVDGAGNVHVIWTKWVAGYTEVFYREKRNPGVWMDAYQLTAAFGSAELPSAAAGSNGRVHVVWRNDVSESEIYYKEGFPEELARVYVPAATSVTARLCSLNPNPSMAGAGIQFYVSEASRPEVSIYDVTGRLVWNLRMELTGPGKHTVTWQGRDLMGHRVNSGVYFVRFEAGRSTSTKKMVVLR